MEHCDVRGYRRQQFLEILDAIANTDEMLRAKEPYSHAEHNEDGRSDTVQLT